MTPIFFYIFVSGRCLDYVIKLWETNFEPFFAIQTPLAPSFSIRVEGFAWCIIYGHAAREYIFNWSKC